MAEFVILCELNVSFYILNMIYSKLTQINLIGKAAVPLHAMEALGVRGGIAPTHSRPRH
jgi:hypothetical protein